jgi:hypothetical protein
MTVSIDEEEPQATLNVPKQPKVTRELKKLTCFVNPLANQVLHADSEEGPDEGNNGNSNSTHSRDIHRVTSGDVPSDISESSDLASVMIDRYSVEYALSAANKISPNKNQSRFLSLLLKMCTKFQVIFIKRSSTRISGNVVNRGKRSTRNLRRCNNMKLGMWYLVPQFLLIVGVLNINGFSISSEMARSEHV